jgi:PAS domain S-box-containing protein
MDDADIRAIFDRSGAAMLVADDRRRYVDANPAACALLGRSREELVGLRIDDVVVPTHRQRVAATWSAFLAEGSVSGEIGLLDGEGRRVDASYRATASIAPGRHLSVLFAHDRTPSRNGGGISPREREVLQHVARGATSGEIAEELHLSEQTVRTHVRNAMERLHAKTRAHAVALALERGLL